MPVTKTEIFVNDLVKMEVEAFRPGTPSSLVQVKMQTTHDSEVVASFDPGAAQRLAKNLTEMVCQHYKIMTVGMVKQWAESRPWVRKIVATGFDEEVHLTVYVQPMPDDHGARYHRTLDVTSLGMMIGGSIGYLVYSHHYEGDEECYKDQIIAYERKE